MFLIGKVRGMNIRMVLNEVVEYENYGKGEYGFKVKGNTYTVQCYMDKEVMGIMFDDDYGGGKRGDIEITREVLKTVEEIAIKEVKEKRPKRIEIQPTSRSRYRIYMEVAKRLKDELGYEVSTKKDSHNHDWIVISRR